MCLNYCLIYGHFGAPELGIVGAAIATLVSRAVELVIILVYVVFIDRKLRMKLREILHLDFTYLKDYIRISSPVTISGLLWGVAAGGADCCARSYKRKRNSCKQYSRNVWTDICGVWYVMRKHVVGNDRKDYRRGKA